MRGSLTTPPLMRDGDVLGLQSVHLVHPSSGRIIGAEIMPDASC